MPLALHRVKTLTFHLFAAAAAAAAAAKTNSYFLHISTIYTYLLFPMTLSTALTTNILRTHVVSRWVQQKILLS